MGYIITFIFLILLCLVSTKKTRQESFEIVQTYYIRGLLTILVIMNHTFTQAYMLGNIAVSLFLCFSGFGLTKSYSTKGREYLSWEQYWKGKMSNIVVPYCLINLCYIVWFSLHENKQYSLGTILRSFVSAEIMPVGWYTIEIILLYAIFFLCIEYHFLKSVTSYIL